MVIDGTVARTFCDTSYYGLPSIGDCVGLLNDFVNKVDQATRVYDEEQLRTNDRGSWPGLHGIVTRDMIPQAVQIPRLFTRGSCNFMLSSHASATLGIVPLGTSSWATIHRMGDLLITECMRHATAPAGGVIFIPPVAQHTLVRVLTLWMWQTGSMWDGMVNCYMNAPGGLVPPSPDRLTNLSSTLSREADGGCAHLGAIFSNTTASINPLNDAGKGSLGANGEVTS
ncbi:MAG: hypothetical protein Q9163_001435 [Psora crenata]